MRDYIALAIPFFFLLIGVELLWARARRVRVYRFNDALTDLSCGIASTVAPLLYGALQLAAYVWLYDHGRLFTLTPALGWVAAFVGVDFAYYWWHRASHQVNVLWAAHIVHHQSEDYNLAVALRQAVLTSWTSLPFYAPLALLGVAPLQFGIARAFSTLYQFWIHTQLIGRISGPLAYVFNLPSHHRVHHAINPVYLDKNFGATSIVWDRWFGTYQDESEPPVYGITKPLASFNPCWAQVHYWFELGRLSRSAPRCADRLRVWWKSPRWRPQGVPAVHVDTVSPSAWPKYDVSLSRRLRTYLWLHYASLVVATTALLFYATALPASLQATAVGLILLTTLSLGALIEGRRWAIPVELVRLACTTAFAASWALA